MLVLEGQGNKRRGQYTSRTMLDEDYITLGE